MRVRIDNNANYKSVFFKGKTIRMNINPLLEIKTPKYPEIEDVAINSKCLANCFTGETQVLTSKGYIEIKDICINDVVISYNENNKLFESKLVYDLFKNKYEGELIIIELEDGKIIQCTPNHKFLTNRGWIKSSDLLESDDLINY